MNPTNPIEAAVALAQQAAQNQPQAATTAQPGTAVTTQQGGAVAAPATPGKRLTMEEMAIGSMSVDAWLKVNQHGLNIGDNPRLFTPDEGGLIVDITMTDGSGFIPKKAIKGGNPAQYAYTMDGVTAVGGGTWPEAQDRIRRLEPGKSINEYRAVDLPMTLVGEFKRVLVDGKPTIQDVEGDVRDKTGAVLAKAGDVLGYTTSTTNWANWEIFHREVASKALMGQRVRLYISAQPRKNNKNNVWGVVKFDLIGSAADADGE